LTEEKGEMFQKIKIVDTLDIINNDIKKVIIDDYIGRVPNSYDNKCILIVAIKEYLEELEKEELIEVGSLVDIDIEAQKQYLKSKNIDISNMKEQEIREANTGSKVFLKAKIKMLDAMEDIDLSIEI
ncbi:TPA: phage tail sheath protein, partial [Clostridioides difficile]|nr:phage tail sheath protein [Clostridioides difficile]